MAKRKITPKFNPDDICIFRNKGSSGYTGNDGKSCRIVKIKKVWVNPQIPEYIIEFTKDAYQIGASELELSKQQNPTNQETSNDCKCKNKKTKNTKP